VVEAPGLALGQAATCQQLAAKHAQSIQPIPLKGHEQVHNRYRECAADKGRRSIEVDRALQRAAVRCLGAEHYVAVRYAVDSRRIWRASYLRPMNPIRQHYGVSHYVPRAPDRGHDAIT
jgi:hypothetical protein